MAYWKEIKQKILVNYWARNWGKNMEGRGGKKENPVTRNEKGTQSQKN